MNIYYLWLMIFLLVSDVALAQEDTLNYLIFPAPPYMIEAAQPDDFSGIDIDIVRIIARHMNLKINFIKCPWKRCLAMMEDGDADLLSSAYKNLEREAFMDFFDTPYLDSLPIAFYMKKGKDNSIETYDDLYHLKTIGMLRGASYFERFDNDKTLVKINVTSQNQLIPMLIEDRFDAFAGYVNTVNFRIVAEGFKGKIVKSTYEYKDNANVYMALSKKSLVSKRRAEFNVLNNTLIKNGVIQKIVQSYYDTYRVD